MAELKIIDMATNGISSLNKYVFISNAYYAEGGFNDGSYLTPYVRESNFTNRKKISVYRNFLKPILDATVEPVFNKTITRETDNVLFGGFLKDVDVRGNDMNYNSHNCLRNSRLWGVNFTVMDNFKEQPETVNEALYDRKYPYVYTEPAYAVDSYKTDEFGNLTEITFKHNTEWEGKSGILYTTWDDMNTTKKTYVSNKVVAEEVNKHGLGVIPVIATYIGDNSQILPTPPLYSIGRLCQSIYDKDSEIRDQERAQAFSVFYIQTDTNTASIEMGAHNAIIIPASDEIKFTPGYTSPEPRILEMLMSNDEKLIASLYELAEQQGIIAVQKANSGIAASYKFISINNQLQTTAKTAVKYEEKLAKLFGLYIGEEVNYEVQYPQTFDPIVSVDNFQNIQSLLNMGLGNDIKLEIKKVLAKQFLNHLDEKRMGELINTIPLENKEIKENNEDF